VIVSADMGEMTLACVAELDDPALASVIVVDNAFGGDGGEGGGRGGGGDGGGGDGGRGAGDAGSARREIGARARVVALDAPHGFAAANNRGIAAGRAPFVLLLNSDVLVTAGVIGALLDALGAWPGAVAAGGRLVDPDTLATQEQYRPRPFPTLANFLVIVLGVEELWPGNPVTRRYHGAQLEDEGVQAVAQPAAAAILVRRDALAAVAGFDERFWFWFEDSDLLLRLSARGPVLYAPSAVFRHLGGGSFRKWGKPERIRSIHHGIVHYADAHFTRARRAVLGLAELAISLPRVALFARSRPREADAWRDVARGGLALVRGGRPGAIAPGPIAPGP
jgi:N-acetylglucosaminyl-diphospho-decaprenol L-rhamnosyltransferase